MIQNINFQSSKIYSIFTKEGGLPKCYVNLHIDTYI